MTKPKVNYQILLDEKIQQLIKSNIRPTLLLHCCCAPCSSYVLEYLNRYFDITLYFYNPNIYPKSEFDKRSDEVQCLIEQMPLKSMVKIKVGDYDSSLFFEIAKGLEDQPEGSTRCFKCYKLRLSDTAKVAKQHNFDYFTTTLSISPYKNADMLNKIGELVSEENSVKYLYSDFKKKNGYLRSIELSKKYNLYRQSYCGCVFSKQQAENHNNNE